MRPLRLCLTLTLLLAGCVSPLVNFTPYSNPYFPKDEFEKAFTSWKAGRAVTWEVHYKGTAFSEDELVVNSNGQGSLGPRLPSSSRQTKTFQAAKADLTRLADRLVASGIFGLYDGYYGAWTQATGAGGSEVRVLASGLEKHVAKDPNLSTAVSLEASAIQGACDAMLELAGKYVK
jgi:hypothetical protein